MDSTAETERDCVWSCSFSCASNLSMPAGHKRRDDCTQTQAEATDPQTRVGDGDGDVDQDKSSAAGSPVAWLSLLLLTVFAVVVAAAFCCRFFLGAASLCMSSMVVTLGATLMWPKKKSQLHFNTHY